MRAAAGGAAAAAGVFALERGRVALVDDQPVVVEQLLAGLQVAQRADEDAAVDLVGLQLGSQAWLIQRDALPPTLASMT
jgi:hypothetical protein